MSLTSSLKLSHNQQTQSNQNKKANSGCCSHACVQEQGSPQRHTFHWKKIFVQSFDKSVWQTWGENIAVLRCYTTTTTYMSNIWLPKQVGGASLQKPVEVHVSVCVPFRENPFWQEKKHWEPNLSSSTGWEQFTDRDGGKTRMASHCKAEEQIGYKSNNEY